MQAIEIGILGHPVHVCISSRDSLLQGRQRFRLLTEYAVGAGGIVESIAVLGPKGDGGLPCLSVSLTSP